MIEDQSIFPLVIILTEIKGEDIDITSDSDNGEDELEILAAVREGQRRDP